MGHLVQGITGIPWYYRQFGYEMAITLDNGRALPPAQVPVLTDGTAEPFRLRPATAADVPFITELDARGRERWLVSCVRDAATWRYEMVGRTEQNAERQLVLVIETNEAARPVGMLAHNPWLWRGALGVGAYELAPDASLLAVTPSVLRALRGIGERYAAEGKIGVPAPGPDPFTRIVFRFDDAHPVYEALPADALANPSPYAWYVRVPDLPAFIRRVAPVLERRLAGAAATNYAGSLCLSFYRDGVRLDFDRGRLVAVEPWAPPDDDDAPDAGFPPLTFLQLLFGYRSLAELRRAFPDCWAKPEAAVVLDALFPCLPSHIWPIA